MYHRIRKTVLNTLTKTPLETPARKIYGTLVKSKGNQYDKQTFDLMKKVLHKNSNCVDIGAYRGEILREILKNSPRGMHFAFEPVPENYMFLEKKFPGVNIHNIALSDKKGKTTFQHVVGRAARSGLLKVDYPDENQEIAEIEVEVDTLDNIISDNTSVNLIKIDVEGAELGVLTGAQKIIGRYKPYIIFEHDEKAKTYKASPDQIYELLDELGMKVCLIKDFLEDEKATLSKTHFKRLVAKGLETYFLAYAK